MYRKQLGFVEVDRKVSIMRAALNLNELFQASGNLDISVLEALELVADVKTFLNAVKVPQLLRLGAHPQFKTGTPAYIHLMRLLHAFYEDAGLADSKISRFKYVEDPVMTMGEVIEMTVAQEVRIMSVTDDLNGDKTLWGAFASEFLEWFYSIIRIKADTKELELRLLAYRKHIVFKLTMGIALTPQEKTFILAYHPGSPHVTEGGNWDTEEVSAAENSNPLVDRDFSKIWAYGDAGPSSRFYKMMSNKSIEQLLVIVTPGVTVLPLLVGSTYNRGITTELDLEPIGAVSYSDATDVAGIREKLRVPSKSSNPVVSVKNRYSVAMPATIYQTWDPFKDSSLRFDLPEVDITLRNKQDLLTSAEPFAGMRLSWVSAWRDSRPVNTVDGATWRDLIIDLALTNEVYGSGAPIAPTLPEKALIDSHEPSVNQRINHFGLTRYAKFVSIVFKFYLLRDMTLQEVDVDMTYFYSRRGGEMVRPTFVEKVVPPMAVLYNENSAAIDFVAADQGLSIEEKKLNRLAITMAFNYNELNKLYSITPAVSDIRNLIAVTLNA